MRKSSSNASISSFLNLSLSSAVVSVGVDLGAANWEFSNSLGKGGGVLLGGGGRDPDLDLPPFSLPPPPVALPKGEAEARDLELSSR